MSWYIFGQGNQISYVHESALLKKQDKTNYTLIVEELPEQNTPDNHYAQLVLVDGVLQWVYQEVVKE